MRFPLENGLPSDPSMLSYDSFPILPVYCLRLTEMNGPLRSILPVSPSQPPKEMGCKRIIPCSGFVLNRIPPLFYTPAAFGEARSKPVRGRPSAIRPNTCGWQVIVDYFAFVDYPVYTVKASLFPLATWNFPYDSAEQGTPCGVS